MKICTSLLTLALMLTVSVPSFAVQAEVEHDEEQEEERKSSKKEAPNRVSENRELKGTKR